MQKHPLFFPLGAIICLVFGTTLLIANPESRLVGNACVVVLLITAFVFLFPYPAMAIGFLLGNVARCYPLAYAWYFSSYVLFRLPFLDWCIQASPLFAIQLSDLEMLAGEFVRCQDWAEKALKINSEPEPNHLLYVIGHGITKRALANAGRACFYLGQQETAEDYGRKAWEVWAIEDDGSDETAAFIPAENFDLLALIKMQAGDLGQAEQLFSRSSELRTRSCFSQRSASAYVKNSRGTIELGRNNMTEATAPIMEAAQDLIALRKKNYPSPPDLNVVVSVLMNLRRLESEAANQVYQELYSRHKRDFSPVHEKLLSQ